MRSDTITQLIEQDLALLQWAAVSCAGISLYFLVIRLIVIRVGIFEGRWAPSNEGSRSAPYVSPASSTSPEGGATAGQPAARGDVISLHADRARAGTPGGIQDATTWPPQDASGSP